MTERSRPKRSLRTESILVASGRPERSPGEPINPPVTLSATYHAEGEPEYGREGNPTWAALEETLGTLEGGGCALFASGMAAASALLDDLPLGAAVVAPQNAYQGVRQLLAERERTGRLRVRLVPIADTEAAAAAIPGAALVWIETPTNPHLDIADIEALAAAAAGHGARVVVDNTLATPLRQRPLELGATASLHSATKFISGHADLVLGAVITDDDEVTASLHSRRTLEGAIPGPMDAYLALRGLRTMALRLDRAEASAADLAQRLADHPGVARVRYPGLANHPGHELARRQMGGFGALLSFETLGDAATADRVCAAVRLITHATSLGGVESLIERRARYASEREAGVPETLLRLSVGIEHVDDLWEDLEAALATAGVAAS
jgi:cystathionine gamma-synthase